MRDMQPVTVVFDLDGTLVDTAPDLIHATNHVLALVDLAPVSETLLRPFISFGSRRMIEEALAYHGRQLPPDEIERMWRAFLIYYAENIAIDSRPYPGVENALDTLASKGIRLAVCTNKLEVLSLRLLATLGLDNRFTAICGRDTFPVCKPDPGHLTRTIAAAGGTADRAVMIGDSDTDVSTARAASIPFIGVGFGYTDIPMQQLAPDRLINGYNEFIDALASLRLI